MLFPAKDLGKRTKMSACPFARCKSKQPLHSSLLQLPPPGGLIQNRSGRSRESDTHFTGGRREAPSTGLCANCSFNAIF